MLDVLFATNEDCDLLVNNEVSGQVLKSQFRYLKLAPGTYRYTAKSKRTGDEMSESFLVSAGGVNEVFMDLLYVVDEKQAQRTALQKSAIDADVALPSKGKGGKTDTRSLESRKEAEQRTVNFLVTNTAFLKGGSFVMGNNRARTRDEAEHLVSIAPVYFGKYEVTQDQWESIMGYNPSLHKGCPTCPVENVSWEDVMKFIRKLNSLSNKKFRLPTEAEWEYAAKLGGRIEVEKAGGQEAYIKKMAWFHANSASRTQPVGTKAPDVSGVYDLIGNVSEWCVDWYGAGFYKEERSQRNPEGPPGGKEKVVRGGNYKDYVGDRFRPSFRNKRLPTGKSSELGFRVVMEPGE